MPASAIHPTREVVTVEVREADADRWQQALIRGQEQQLAVSRVVWRWTQAGALEQYLVRSSRGELWYAVDVINLGSRGLVASCPCEAGRLARICKHQALVIDHLKLWPFPIASQAAMPLEGEGQHSEIEV